jgi:hypothetical protein
MKLLRREEAAQYLKSKGLRASNIMLARHAMSGTGAKYTIIGRTAYYTEEWLDEWLKSQLKPDTHAFAHMQS